MQTKGSWESGVCMRAHRSETLYANRVLPDHCSFSLAFSNQLIIEYHISSGGEYALFISRMKGEGAPPYLLPRGNNGLTHESSGWRFTWGKTNNVLLVVRKIIDESTRSRHVCPLCIDARIVTPPILNKCCFELLMDFLVKYDLNKIWHKQIMKDIICIVLIDYVNFKS